MNSLRTLRRASGSIRKIQLLLAARRSLGGVVVSQHHHAVATRPVLVNQHNNLQVAVRWFQSEAEYHPVADATLETIQDSLDEVLEATQIEYEVNLASGVLTFSMPPHGTWVLNKQTPNQQIWWSSPLSGPKRFEFDADDALWFATKDGQNLGRELVQEICRFYPELADFEIQA